MVTEFKQPTKEELEKQQAELQVMEIFARLGGRTIGVKLEGDKK